jgi:hypothetical protein
MFAAMPGGRRRSSLKKFAQLLWAAQASPATPSVTRIQTLDKKVPSSLPSFLANWWDFVVRGLHRRVIALDDVSCPCADVI